MKRFHRYLLIVWLVLGVSGCEVKGEDMARMKAISVTTVEGLTNIRISIPWTEKMAEVQIWIDPPPDSPSEMPYRRQARILALGYKNPPKIVRIKIEATTSNGETWTDSQPVVIPAASTDPKDQQPPRYKSASGVDGVVDAAPMKARRKLKADVKVKIHRKGSATVWDYQFTNNDDADVVTIILGITSQVQLESQPRGWLCHHQEGGAITCGAKDPGAAIRPGKSLNGFVVVGSGNKTNISYSIMSMGAGSIYGETVGPGN